MEHSPPSEPDILPGTRDIRHLSFFILNVFLPCSENPCSDPYSDPDDFGPHSPNFF